MSVSLRPIEAAVEAVALRIEADAFRQRRDGALLALDRARRFAAAGERLTLEQIGEIMREQFGVRWERDKVAAEIAKARARTRSSAM